MSIHSYRTNLETEVLAASPLDLIRMLYRGAIASVDKALRHLDRGEIKARSNEINKACMIIAELQAAVDRETGGELSTRLIALYDYAIRLLIDANVRQAAAPLVEVTGILRTLQDAWDSVTEPVVNAKRDARSAFAANYGFAPEESGTAAGGLLF